MKVAQVPTLGTTLVEASWQEQAAKVYCLFMHNLASANIVVTQSESTDYDDLMTDLSGFSTGFKTYLEGLPSIDDGSDPLTRAVPANPEGGSWVSIASRVASLAAMGAAGGVPGLLLNVAFDVGLEIFSKWLAGKVYPSNFGSLDELAVIARKAFLRDPGIMNLERSVFVAEKPDISEVGGELESIGQFLYRYLYRDPVGDETEQQPRYEDLLKAFHAFSDWYVKANVGGSEVVFSAGSIAGEQVQ